MRYFFTCLALQLRLVRKKALALLAMALAALFLSAAVAVAGSILLSQRNFTGVSLAVATEDGDETIDAMIELLGSMQDLSDFATIHRTTPQQARQMVQSGNATVALILPAGFLNSVLTGENLMPQLVVDTSRPLETMLVVKLAESATRMLSTAQQGITYTLQVYSSQPGAAPSQGTVVRDVNLLFASWVLSRNNLFRSALVSPSGSLSLVQYYALGAILFFALLCMPVLYRQFSFGHQGPWLARMRAGGRSFCGYMAAAVLCGAAAVLPALVLLLLGCAALGGGAVFAPSLLLALPLIALCFSAFTFLCCNTGSILAAVSLNFILAVAAILCCGGIVPLALLPSPVAALAPLSPLGWMRDILSPLFGATQSWASMLWLAAFTAVLFAGCLLFARYKQRGRLAI